MPQYKKYSLEQPISICHSARRDFAFSAHLVCQQHHSQKLVQMEAVAESSSSSPAHVQDSTSKGQRNGTSQALGVLGSPLSSPCTRCPPDLAKLSQTRLCSDRSHSRQSSITFSGAPKEILVPGIVHKPMSTFAFHLSTHKPLVTTPNQFVAESAVSESNQVLVSRSYEICGLLTPSG